MNEFRSPLRAGMPQEWYYLVADAGYEMAAWLMVGCAPWWAGATQLCESESALSQVLADYNALVPLDERIFSHLVSSKRIVIEVCGEPQD
jgi:hypothetical protein